jgi:hypothetical protein
LSDVKKLNRRIGERVKLTALGKERSPRIAEKVGTVIRRTPYSSIVGVLFDGNRLSTSIHKDYIEPIDLEH